jgi:Uma2 family endonuclease
MSTMAVGQPPLDIDMVITLNVEDGGLDRYLELVGDRRGPRIKYRQGSLTLVSPTYGHERAIQYLDDLITAVCFELNIDYHATRSTLFRPPKRESGIEADASYYIANEPAVRGVTEDIDLTVTPPPDLALEVIVSHGPAQALAIYQELGVPEVWVYWAKKRKLEFLQLDEQGEYHPGKVSRSFPFLTPEDVLPWAEPSEGEPDIQRERRLRAWVRDVLAPRHGPRRDDR